jgi:hypothetical protein
VRRISKLLFVLLFALALALWAGPGLSREPDALASARAATLVVHVVDAGDHPLAGRAVIAGEHELRTDSTGHARFTGLQPGIWSIVLAGSSSAARVELDPGETRELRLVASGP